ncbi:MAG: hypothetical protein QXF97_08535 [Candidatus Caldarchaeum sp.]
MSRKKTKTKTRRTGRKKGAKIIRDRVKNMPKPIREKVQLQAETPEDIDVIEPARGDPIVRVKGKTIGAWVDI